jgi:hypothetical protein
VNLDGRIDADDYGRVNNHVPGTLGWYNCDFNYDGVFNLDDHDIIDVNAGMQGDPL